MSKTLNEIIDEVCEKMSIDRDELLGPGRTQEFVKARRRIGNAAQGEGFKISQIAKALNRKAGNIRYLLSNDKTCAPAMGQVELKRRIAFAMSDGRERTSEDIARSVGCGLGAAIVRANQLVDEGLLDKDSGMRPVIFKKSQMNDLVQVDEAAKRAARVFIKNMGLN